MELFYNYGWGAQHVLENIGAAEQTWQDQHQETPEAVGDKGQQGNESKQLKEVFRRNMLSMEFWCLMN